MSHKKVSCSSRLVVACLAGSYLAGYLVYFWFVVEIQWCKSSEVKDVGGVKSTF